ncbi:MAG TPA: nucleotide disphospho-sugar-binding domain-containing protein [Bryobacteraceae bacterium]
MLGRALLRRGHRVTVFSLADVEPTVQREGLGFSPLGPEQYPMGSLALLLEALKQQQGFRSSLFVIRAAAQIVRLILEHAPAALQVEAVDAVLADQNEPASASVAEYLGLPFASICTSLPINREAGIPPSFTNWEYKSGAFSKLRNKLGYKVSDVFTRNLQATLNEYRKRWRLNELRSPDDSFSRIAQIAQMPAEFDFPRQMPPPNLHYTGPWVDEVFEKSASTSEFPLDRLDGRPVLYVSLGTLQNVHSKYFNIIAEACTGLNLQVVISVGAKKNAGLPKLPGNHLVVRYAPQIAVLRRSALAITHAGMNTTMHALHFGIPLIAIPLAHDQPAIAARLKRTGAGVVFSPNELTVQKLRRAIDSILENDSAWKVHARRMQQVIAEAGGVERAADIVEQSMSAGRARLRTLKPQPELQLL